jgi:acyl-CoA dehydrogenase
MTTFHLDEGHLRTREEARVLARDVLAPVAHRGTPGRVNRELVRALGTSGLLPRLFPSGGTVSAVELCLLREGLAMECPEAETALALQGLGSYPVLLGGSRELAERWMPRVADGTAVAAIALSEPEAGSDAAAIALRADRCSRARPRTRAPGASRPSSSPATRRA